MSSEPWQEYELRHNKYKKRQRAKKAAEGLGSDSTSTSPSNHAHPPPPAAAIGPSVTVNLPTRPPPADQNVNNDASSKGDPHITAQAQSVRADPEREEASPAAPREVNPQAPASASHDVTNGTDERQPESERDIGNGDRRPIWERMRLPVRAGWGAGGKAQGPAPADPLDGDEVWSKDGALKKEIYLPAATVGMAVGKQGNNLHRIQAEKIVTVLVGQDASHKSRTVLSQGRREVLRAASDADRQDLVRKQREESSRPVRVVIRGFTEETVEDAADALDMVVTHREIPKKMVGWTLGKKHENIREIATLSSAILDVYDYPLVDTSLANTNTHTNNSHTDKTADDPHVAKEVPKVTSKESDGQGERERHVESDAPNCPDGEVSGGEHDNEGGHEEHGEEPGLLIEIKGPRHAVESAEMLIDVHQMYFDVFEEMRKIDQDLKDQIEESNKGTAFVPTAGRRGNDQKTKAKEGAENDHGGAAAGSTLHGEQQEKHHSAPGSRGNSRPPSAGGGSGSGSGGRPQAKSYYPKATVYQPKQQQQQQQHTNGNGNSSKPDPPASHHSGQQQHQQQQQQKQHKQTQVYVPVKRATGGTEGGVGEKRKMEHDGEGPRDGEGAEKGAGGE
ncbi:unnamed protein product [Vitrella brassicaformis CCMP3155]|uniref:K Homology domain-containing protein n=2 Tax=Vitrella brassicaformis TaxID=1169539 RepID=A0A0G4FGG4_VITBC|nr:unnamed protein product [Vitrella brassicaformis CCMP3155]|eukprot:CEM11924.1 unnamed protein product [Vitrella brassicaformis CCMP3155]